LSSLGENGFFIIRLRETALVERRTVHDAAEYLVPTRAVSSAKPLGTARRRANLRDGKREERV